MLIRIKEDCYTLIRLEVFADPQPRPPAPADDPFAPSWIVEAPTPTATLDWFQRRPHPDSGYGAYDGRCGACGSPDTLCLRLARRAIAPRVDEVLGDIACQAPGCGMYTVFSYDRDSS